MFRVDVDAHIDETEATWEYLDDGARRFKPVLVDPGAATAPGDARPHRLWLIDGTIQLKRWRDDLRTGTVQATRELLDVDARVRHMDELRVDVQVLYPTLFLHAFTARRRDRRGTVQILQSLDRQRPRRRAAAGCAGSRCCRCSISTRPWKSCVGPRITAPAACSRRASKLAAAPPAIHISFQSTTRPAASTCLFASTTPTGTHRVRHDRRVRPRRRHDRHRRVQRARRAWHPGHVSQA